MNKSNIHKQDENTINHRRDDSGDDEWIEAYDAMIMHIEVIKQREQQAILEEENKNIKVDK